MGGGGPKGANVTAVSSNIKFLCYMLCFRNGGSGQSHIKWGYAIRPADIFLALHNLYLGTVLTKENRPTCLSFWHFITFQ